MRGTSPTRTSGPPDLVWRAAQAHLCAYLAVTSACSADQHAWLFPLAYPPYHCFARCCTCRDSSSETSCASPMRWMRRTKSTRRGCKINPDRHSVVAALTEAQVVRARRHRGQRRVWETEGGAIRRCDGWRCSCSSTSRKRPRRLTPGAGNGVGRLDTQGCAERLPCLRMLLSLRSQQSPICLSTSASHHKPLTLSPAHPRSMQVVLAVPSIRERAAAST